MGGFLLAFSGHSRYTEKATYIEGGIA